MLYVNDCDLSMDEQGKCFKKSIFHQRNFKFLLNLPDLAATEVVDELLECDCGSVSGSEGQEGQVSSADSSVDRSLVAAAFGKVSEEPYPAEIADVESFVAAAACLD